MNSRSADPLPRMGSGIVLRRLRAGDLAAFQAYRADPEVGKFQGWSPMPGDAATAYLRGMELAPFGVANEWLQLGIAEAATDRLIGDLGFCICGPDDAHAELGLSLSREFQGRGLATEAARAAIHLLFECTAIARVMAMTDERNLACIRLLERVGMKQVSVVNSVLRGERFLERVYVHERDR